MRWLLTLAMVFAVSITAEAKKKPAQFDGQLLSYAQLMKLTSAKRMKYIKDVRELLIYMEKAQGKYEISSNYEMQNLKEYVAQMMKMMAVFPEAEAAEGEAPAPPSFIPHWVDGRGWTCTGTVREFDVAFDPSLGTCAFRQKTGMRQTPTFWFSPPRGEQTSCPTEDSTALGSAGGSRKCIPNDSWRELSTEQKRFLSRDGRLPNDFFKVDRGPQDTIHAVLGAGNRRADGSLMTDPQPQQTSRPPTERPPAERPTEEIPAENPIAGTNLSGGAPPAPPAAACVKPTFDCDKPENQANKDALIAQFRRDSDNVCIAGGFFTEYRQGKKRVGNCDWKREFKLPSARAPMKCKNNNEAFCNPAVFCVGLKVDDALKNLVRTDPYVASQVAADGKAETALANLEKVKLKTDGQQIVQSVLCAKVGQDLTEQCDIAMKAHINKETSGFPDRKPRGENYMACDPTKMEGMKNQREWDNFATDVRNKYRQWCANNQQKFTALFCSECKIISERIMAMNNSATGEPCVTGPAPSAAPRPTEEGAPEGVREGQPGAG